MKTKTLYKKKDGLTVKLDNSTHYRSRDLAKLFMVVFQNYKRERPDFTRTSMFVGCIYRRTKDGFCGGYAYYNSGHVVMKLPKVKTERGYSSNDTFAQGIARTFHHELDHCYGLKHGNMVSEHIRNVKYIDFDIAEKSKPQKKEKTDDIKIISLQERRKKWESKIKRAKTAIVKINRTLKYYDRKMAAKSKR